MTATLTTTTAVCTVPWCQYVGTSGCDSGEDSEGRNFWAHDPGLSFHVESETGTGGIGVYGIAEQVNDGPVGPIRLTLDETPGVRLTPDDVLRLADGIRDMAEQAAAEVAR